MNVLGSFFLGDAHHMRLRSSSTSPPISPTPSLTLHGQQQQQYSSPGMAFGIHPELSLELRLRWLEAVVNGVKDVRRSKNVDPDDDSGRERSVKPNPEGI